MSFQAFPIGTNVQLKQILLKIKPRNASARPGAQDTYKLGHGVILVGVESTIQAKLYIKVSWSDPSIRSCEVRST